MHDYMTRSSKSTQTKKISIKSNITICVKINWAQWYKNGYEPLGIFHVGLRIDERLHEQMNEWMKVLGHVCILFNLWNDTNYMVTDCSLLAIFSICKIWLQQNKKKKKQQMAMSWISVGVASRVVLSLKRKFIISLQVRDI